jgi:hypothetical protein
MQTPVVLVFACLIANRDLVYVVYEQPALAMCRTEGQPHREGQLHRGLELLNVSADYEQGVRHIIKNAQKHRPTSLAMDTLQQSAKLLPFLVQPEPQPVAEPEPEMEPERERELEPQDNTLDKFNGFDRMVLADLAISADFNCEGLPADSLEQASSDEVDQEPEPEPLTIVPDDLDDFDNVPSADLARLAGSDSAGMPADTLEQSGSEEVQITHSTDNENLLISTIRLLDLVEQDGSDLGQWLRADGNEDTGSVSFLKVSSEDSYMMDWATSV